MITYPYRSEYPVIGRARPDGIKLPPQSMPLLNAAKLRKQWLYVGGYSADVMFCVLTAKVGPFRQSAVALIDRSNGSYIESTRFGYNRLAVSQERVLVDHPRLKVDLLLSAPTNGFEVINPSQGSYTWTHKRTALASGYVRINGKQIEIDIPVLVDHSAGYHPRETTWCWSAGIGTAVGNQEPVAWSVVTGINDPEKDSERTLWRGDKTEELDPVAIPERLDQVIFSSGERLTFQTEHERSRNENLVLIRSSYRQPFGTFSGSLPKVGEIDTAFGVMEYHRALW